MTPEIGFAVGYYGFYVVMLIALFLSWYASYRTMRAMVPKVHPAITILASTAIWVGLLAATIVVMLKAMMP